MMRPLIYDVVLNIEEENIQAMDWISFMDFKQHSLLRNPFSH